MEAQWGETLVILCTLDNRLLTYVYLTLTSMTGSRKVFPRPYRIHIALGDRIQIGDSAVYSNSPNSFHIPPVMLLVSEGAT